jgi:hypothetical protein
VRRLVAVLVLVLAGCATGSHGMAGGGQAAGTPRAVRSAPQATPAPWLLPARVVLPATTMTAGSSMTGHVLVDNTTGHAIHVAGCGSLFQILLTSGNYRPAVAWPSCLQWLTIPAGKTSYRVTLSASYSQCSQGGRQDGLIACPPGPRMPPLPAGTYHARLFQSSPLARLPPTITVVVTPPGR